MMYNTTSELELMDSREARGTEEDEDDIDETGSSTNEEEAIKNYESDESASESRSLISNGSEEDLMSKLFLFGRGATLDIDYGTTETAVDWIRSGNCRNIIIISGAGVSCAAGIPDFRTPGTGLYDNLQRFNLPYPQAVFDIDFYRNNPQPFVSLASEIWPGGHSPTLTHSFMKLLERHNLLLRNYTQNIDGLEILAGMNPESVMCCHGHFQSARCIECKYPHPADSCYDSIVKQKKVPICEKCGEYAKPDIVFFGEGLPPKMFCTLQNDLKNVDLVIVMGTSLTVAPVSHIPNMVPVNTKRLLINRDLVGGFCMGEWEDVFLPGDCDQSVLTLCELLGWREDLEALNASTRINTVTAPMNDNNTRSFPDNFKNQNEIQI